MASTFGFIAAYRYLLAMTIGWAHGNCVWSTYIAWFSLFVAAAILLASLRFGFSGSVSLVARQSAYAAILPVTSPREHSGTRSVSEAAECSYQKEMVPSDLILSLAHRGHAPH